MSVFFVRVFDMPITTSKVLIFENVISVISFLVLIIITFLLISLTKWRVNVFTKGFVNLDQMMKFVTGKVFSIFYMV